MKLITVGPNLPEGPYAIHVHAEGCRDLSSRRYRGADRDDVAWEYASKQDVVTGCYDPSNFEYDPDDPVQYAPYRSDIWFAPCCDGLPETAPSEAQLLLDAVGQLQAIEEFAGSKAACPGCGQVEDHDTGCSPESELIDETVVDEMGDVVPVSEQLRESIDRLEPPEEMVVRVGHTISNDVRLVSSLPKVTDAQRKTLKALQELQFEQGNPTLGTSARDVSNRIYPAEVRSTPKSLRSSPVSNTGYIRNAALNLSRLVEKGLVQQHASGGYAMTFLGKAVLEA